jgi:acetolactate synthase-1/2/3 large subunit
LETAARYGLNVVVVVNDNGSLNQETRGITAAYGSDRPDSSAKMWIFEPVDYVKVAESMGCTAVRAETPAAFRQALERAFASDRPVVIDAISDMKALAPTS